MRVKEHVLEILEQRRGEAVSGEELAASIKVSRASVWKAVNALRSQGYKIAGVTNRGYCLMGENNLISREGISAHLQDEKKYQIHVYDTVDSTNTRAKQLAAEGCPSDTIVIANKQTAGKGRLGRNFYSPPDSGLYLSYVLRTNLRAEDAVLITTAVSVAAARAIQNLTGQEVKIKWVNDLYYKEKKICGILTEAISDFESGCIEAVVIGIGINLSTEQFPDGIRQTAGSLEIDMRQISRNMLAAAVITEVSGLEKMICNRSFLDEYRERSMVIGQRVSIVQQEGRIVEVLGIDQNGGLIVKDAEGNQEVLRSGEISIRLTKFTESDSMK